MLRLAVCAHPSRARTVRGPEGAGWKRAPCCGPVRAVRGLEHRGAHERAARAHAHNLQVSMQVSTGVFTVFLLLLLFFY